MDFEPREDGITHINVFSKSRSKLGRMLSNFARTPITTETDKFATVESWWYWTKMNNINTSCIVPLFTDEQLIEIKDKIGKEAKDYFRALYKNDSSEFSPTKEQLKETYKLKLEQHPEVKELLLKNTLPLAHYYMMFNKKVSADSTLWTALLWDEIKDEYNGNTENKGLDKA